MKSELEYLDEGTDHESEEEENFNDAVGNFMSQNPTEPSQIQWLLTSPTIPFTMRKEFFMLWENISTANLNETEIVMLMFDFREWAINYIMSMPEDEHGNRMDYRDDPNGHVMLRTDLVRLLVMLRSLLRVQLSKGRDGFTVKMMRTSHNISESKELSGNINQPKKWYNK